ncbi:APC family permease [Candidatus Gracilibacteria bacterium]|nr:APC family permease [Candidatus Gracilibacteria bacterium]
MHFNEKSKKDYMILFTFCKATVKYRGKQNLFSDLMHTQVEKRHKLGEIASTAICGNDIMSSVLYVSGIAIGVSGIYAPFILLAIGIVLLLYRGVYREVVESLPVNGGTYNALLNGTSKNIAATAGVLTILSYVATCVISGKTAVEYLGTIMNIPIIPATIVVLGLFAMLVISGVKDSSKVAIAIFGLHLLTLTAFVILGAYYLLNHPNQFQINFAHTQNLLKDQSMLILLFLGFSSSLLGVSGFESSADFVEEQERGVFKKTLTNMLLGVVIFNPLVAFLCLGISSMPEIGQLSSFLLAGEAKAVGGSIFQYIVVIDAFLVLCGGVLTGFIGVSGLVNRMSVDESLPFWFAHRNAKGSYPRIVLTFFALCASILLVTGGDLRSLAGVYAISFLSVMSMFALGNLILKITRPDLKRFYSFPGLLVFLAFVTTFIGLIGNISMDIMNLALFLIYFLPVMVIVRAYIYRDYIVSFIYKHTAQTSLLHKIFRVIFRNVVRGTYILFIHRADRLFNTLKYISANEAGRHVIILHCKDDTDEVNKEVWKELNALVPVLPKAGVFPHLRLDLHQVEGEFGPEIIHKASVKYDIPKNRIFIGTIHHNHKFTYDELGGVRIIV